MTCPDCGVKNPAATNHCLNCGAPLAGAEAGSTQPIYAYPVEGKRKTGWLILIAVLAGLGAVAFVFYRVYSRPAPNASGSALSAESTPAVVAPAPKEDDTTISATAEPSASAQRAGRTRKPQHESAPPQLLANDKSASPPPLASSSDSATPMPLPETSAPTSVAAPQAPVNPPSPTPQQAPPAQPPERPAYTGPRAGMATWNGALEKNGTLTINGGTASVGIISGAGLPGVPVRVIIDQTNLGISEMPNASNGYQRLVLRSHAKHDKIVIHWTVIGQ